MSFPGIFGEHGALRDVKDGLTCVIQTRSEEGCRNDVSQISLLLARALWKCPTPRAMTASRGKGQLGSQEGVRANVTVRPLILPCVS